LIIFNYNRSVAGCYMWSLDISAHEFTHGITRHTANLECDNESVR